MNSESELAGERIEQHPNKYLIWDYRRCVVDNIVSEAVTNELQFTNKILLSKGATNIQAWSHREWIIQKFDANLWLPEIQYCHEILDKDIFNVAAWNQIRRAVILNPNMTKELRGIEVAYAKRNIYAQPGNEDILVEEADRIKFAVELDPPPHCMINYASLVDKRGCLHALNLIADLIILGYEASLNTRLVEAVSVLRENLVWTYSSVNPNKVNCRFEFLRDIGALVLSLDASRIRYCNMYRGYFFCWSSPDVEEEEHQQTTYVATDKCEDLPLQSLEELFKSWITSNGFVNLQPKWEKRLFETYLQNRKRYDRTENDALEDLKWNARRLVLKNVGSKEAALYELQYTTNIIKDDAYNHRAWSHRQWVFHIFGEDWDDQVELEFCGEIITKNPYNIFAWDQRHFVVTRLVPKIYKDMYKIRCSKVLLKRHNKFIECLEERRAEELDFTLKIIVANPENQLPWGHISSLHRVYWTSNKSFCFNVRLRHSILHVLEEARDSACCRFGDGSLIRLVGGSACVNNARGIINALNMFLEITVDRNCQIIGENSTIRNLAAGGGERFKAVLDELCPDSLVDTCLYKDIIPVPWKISTVIRSMEIVLRDCGRFMRHATDELFTRNGCFWGFESFT